MSTGTNPLVSVVTPVYNGEDFLVECIESVLKQTYQNYEYIIVNNCSKDRTLEIARAYAAKDRRIRIHDNENFVGVIDNHNLAFSLISPDATYVKVVSADDFIMPDCVARMVDVAEANPSVGFVGCYQISGDRVRWQGFQYPRVVLTGREMCRQMFLGEDRAFGFGSPTSLLYRADLVRSSTAFYPNASPHSDTSACFQFLEKSDFGFVYEVLSYERIHEATQSSKSVQLNRYLSADLNDVIQYGPLYLDQKELDCLLTKTLKSYHRFLALNYFAAFREKEFWDYHESRLAELGHPLKRMDVFKAATATVMREVVNPGQALEKAWARMFPKSRKSVAQIAQPASVNPSANLPKHGAGARIG